MTAALLSKPVRDGAASGASETARRAAGTRRVQAWGPLAVLTALCIVFSVATPDFATVANLGALLDASAIPLILVTGLTFVVLQGSIDLSVEGVMATASMATALLIANSENAHDFGWGAVVFALLASLAFGAANGVLHVALRLPTLMVTLGTWFIGLGIATGLYPARQPQILHPGLQALALSHVAGVSPIDWIALGCVAERAVGNTDPDKLYRLMVGSDADADTYIEQGRVVAGSAAPVRFEVKALAAPGLFEDVSFELRKGETLALAGVAGSGAEAVCRALFGAEPIFSGTMRVDGEQVVLRSPADAVALGIGYVPAERKIEGIVQGRSIHENMVLAFGADLGRGGLLNRRHEKQEVATWMQRLRVKAPSAAERIDALSGGNQQKAVLGRWLLSQRLRVLILDHPTRGLDPGAKADLYRTMRDLARRGLAIVLVADTLEETLGLADQVLVLRDGAVTRRFDNLGHGKPTPEVLVEAMV